MSYDDTPDYGSYASLLIRATDQRRSKKLFGLRSTSARFQRKCFFLLSANLRKIQIMREKFSSKIASTGLSSQPWARFMIKMRQDFGEMTQLSFNGVNVILCVASGRRVLRAIRVLLLISSSFCFQSINVLKLCFPFRKLSSGESEALGVTGSFLGWLPCFYCLCYFLYTISMKEELNEAHSGSWMPQSSAKQLINNLRKIR